MSLVAFIAVAHRSPCCCVMTGPDRDDLDEFYTGYRSLSPLRNGLAIAGDYISAASVLGIGRSHRLVRPRRCRAGAQHRAVPAAADVPAGRTAAATRAGSPWATRSPAGCPAARCASTACAVVTSRRWCR